MTTSSSRIAIAGAGLLGRLLAWRLRKLGHDVTLFDAGSLARPRSAAYTAAAMISPMSEVVVSERAIYDIGIHSLKVWQRWMHELPAAFAGLYQANGSVVVAHAQDENELDQFYADLQFHLGTQNNSRWQNAAELSKLEPGLSTHFQRGLYLPNEAFLDNRTFLDQLLAYLIEAGVNVIENCDVKIGDEITLKRQQDSMSISPPTAYDQWFDCRGIGARDSQNVRGVRGEVIWVETQEVALIRPVRLLHPRYKLYVVPKADNRYILGATEIESEDTSPMSVQSALELCSALYSINPAFAEARILEIDTNLRPSLMDNMPCISSRMVNSHGASTRVTSINGLYRHGYLLAPSLIEVTLSQLGMASSDAEYNLASITDRRSFKT